VVAEDALRHVHALRETAGRGTGGVQETECRHVRKFQWSLAETRPVGDASRAEFRDMAERIGTEIPEGGRIRAAADAEGIENEEKGSRHGSPAVCPYPACRSDGWMNRQTWHGACTRFKRNRRMNETLAQQSEQSIFLPTRRRK
jgi:hypothetical protein